MYYHHISSDFDKSIKISKLPLVYVICVDNFNFIKIGITKSPKNRFSNLQTGCPYKISLWAGIRTPKPKKIESFLHKKLEFCNFRGEWFKPDSDVLDYLSDFFDATNKNVRKSYDALL